MVADTLAVEGAARPTKDGKRRRLGHPSSRTQTNSVIDLLAKRSRNRTLCIVLPLGDGQESNP